MMILEELLKIVLWVLVICAIVLVVTQVDKVLGAL